MTKKQETAVSPGDFTGLMVALAAIASAAVLLFNFSYQQDEASQLVDHTKEVYSYSQKLIICAARADNNLRNYLMTGRALYLQQYEGSRAELQQASQALESLTRSSKVRRLLAERLDPDLQNFLVASDDLAYGAFDPAVGKVAPEALAAQENAGQAFNDALQTVQVEQVGLLHKRNQYLSKLSQQIVWLRAAILLIAFAAILFSTRTLHSVMKKDRAKIESLEKAIEETRQAEQLAAEALAAAHHSSELKSQFMANISHEIRTPMTGIIGLADYLRSEKAALEPETLQCVQVLFKSAQQLLSVLSDLLNFSQLEKRSTTLKEELFDIRRTIEDVAVHARTQADDTQLPLNISIDDAVPDQIMGDEQKVRRVLAALLSNSLKFTHEGVVEISVAQSADDYIKVAVADTGIGIENHDLERIFQPFVQVDGGIRRKAGGAGLSLSIAKQLVDMMAGQIGVMSEPGMGSIFWFTFRGVPQ
jgi:signal transduction histidine kinase